jgi:tetratricopeptide (TPR) repeat protein
MIENENLGDRHTIPRWRSISAARKFGELAPLTPNGIRPSQLRLRDLVQEQVKHDFAKAKAAWETSNGTAEAEELLSSALIAGRKSDPAVLTAAVRISSTARFSPCLAGFAESVIHGDAPPREQLPSIQSVEDARAELARRKSLLSLNPRDSWLLAETALIYANLGQNKKSRSLLLRALKMSPEDRYVLRSATRFFVHIDEPDIAQAALKQATRTEIDPWLMSARLATEAAQGKTVTSWRRAKALLDNSNFSSRDRSELAAEIGTLELSGGSRKQALRILKLGISDPTENAIAQIEWVGRSSRAFNPKDFLPDLGLSDEAIANRAFADSNWTGALDAAERWAALEPFSTRPAIFGSFVASILNHSVERGLALVRAGLRSNPRDFTLLNNSIVLLCYGGRLDAAREEYRRLQELPCNSVDMVTRLATGGLIAFRSGEIEEGIDLYAAAIEHAVMLKEPLLAFRAYCFRAREMAVLDGTVARLLSDNIQAAISFVENRGVVLPKEVEILKDQIDAAAGAKPQLEWGDLSKFDLVSQLSLLE